MPDYTTTENHLKETSQLTGVAWAALAEREAGKWRIITKYHLAKKTQSALVKFLSKTEVDSWLSGALSGGQSRSVSLPESSSLDAGRLFAFPLQGGSRVVLTAADQLGNEAQRIWRLVTSMMQMEAPASDVSASSSVAASLLVPDLHSENPYDLPRALDRALASFVRIVSVQGGWLAVRRGESLEVRAQWETPSSSSLILSIEANTLLRRMSRNLTPMVVTRGDALWSEIPHKGLKSNTRLWVCVPLVIGQRLIGAVAL